MISSGAKVYPNGAAKLDKTHLTVKEAPKGARDYVSDKTPDGTTMAVEAVLVDLSGGDAVGAQVVDVDVG